MRTFKTMSILRPIAIYLAFVCFLTAVLPDNSWAYLIETSRSAVFSREADMGKIQRVLESKMVNQRLAELGLSADEINARMKMLGDEDIHQFASKLESLMPGGHPDLGVSIILLLVVAILVLVIIQMSGHKIIIK